MTFKTLAFLTSMNTQDEDTKMIFGHKRDENGEWKKFHNEELCSCAFHLIYLYIEVWDGKDILPKWKKLGYLYDKSIFSYIYDCIIRLDGA